MLQSIVLAAINYLWISHKKGSALAEGNVRKRNHAHLMFVTSESNVLYLTAVLNLWANNQVAEMAVVEQSVVRWLPNNHPCMVTFHDAGISKADNEVRYFVLSEYCPSNVLKKMSRAAVSTEAGKQVPWDCSVDFNIVCFRGAIRVVVLSDSGIYEIKGG